MRALRSKLRTPSVPIIWLITFLLFFALSRIADQVTVIAFSGFIGNLLGAVCFAFAKRFRTGSTKSVQNAGDVS